MVRLGPALISGILVLAETPAMKRDMCIEKSIQGVRTILGPDNEINCCAYSPDGKRVVSAGSDGLLRIWDNKTSDEILFMEGHTDEVTTCAYSPVGNRLVSSGLDKTIKIWDAETGIKILNFEGHSEAVTCCAYSPNGERIVSSCFDYIIIWDAVTGQIIQSLKGHVVGLNHAAMGFNPYSRALYPVNCCAFSPDNIHVVTAGSDRTLRIWEAETGKETLILMGHTGEVISCSYSPDGSQVVSASTDETLKVWDTETGNEILTLIGHIRGVNCCAYSPDGACVISAGNDCTLKIWDANTGETVASLQLSASALSVAHHPHQSSIACSDQNGFCLIDLVDAIGYSSS